MQTEDVTEHPGNAFSCGASGGPEGAESTLLTEGQGSAAGARCVDWYRLRTPVHLSGDEFTN